MNAQPKAPKEKGLRSAYIIFTLSFILATIICVVMMKPDEFHVERSVVINAPPQAIFEHVNTLRKWEPWSPWVKMDPESIATYAGPASGKDAAMSWDGEKTGAGTMTITESVSNEKIDFRLDFKRPYPGTDTARFTFKPVEGGTNVTWSMDGRMNLPMKFMSLVMDCDAMIGGAFEDGLSSLKKMAETP